MIWVLSFVMGVLTSTTVALALCLINGYLNSFIAYFSVIVGCAVGVFSFWKWKNEVPKLHKLSYFDWAMVLFFMVYCFRHFLWLVFQNGDSVLTIDPSNYGDLPHHIAYMNFLVRGAHFWPQSPLLIGESLTYPFGTDLFSALLTKIGIPFLYHLPVTGFIASLLLAIAFLYWGGGFALGGFLFASGGANYLGLVTHEFKDFQAGKPWSSIILLFTTQRGFIYALPAGLLLLWSWRRRFFTEEKPLPYYVEGLIWGTMPFFHVHTFLFLSFCYGFWILLTRRWNNLNVLYWAFVPACLEVFFVTDHFSRSSILGWKPGWMIEGNIFVFFWFNYGLWTFYTLATGYLSTKKPWAWKQFLPGALLFVICYFVMFAAWDWDNIKLMMWCYILVLPLIYDLSIKQFSPEMRALVIVALFLPGYFAIESMQNPKDRGNGIYSRQAYDGACTALASAKPEDRVASAQIHNHPALLCGHPLVAGYPGVLWALGTHPEKIQAKLQAMMMGDSQWRQIAFELEARYLFWGPYEETAYANSKKPWVNSDLKIVAQGSWGTIYDLGESH